MLLLRARAVMVLEQVTMLCEDGRVSSKDQALAIEGD